MRTIKALFLVSLAGVLFWLSPAPFRAQSAAGAADDVQVIEAMVPMRDGVRLHTVVFTLKSAAEPLPVLLTRTPYGAPDVSRAGAELKQRYQKRLEEEGLMLAFQDIRGRYKSEGQFVMIRPPREAGDPRAIDEGTDAYDTIEWLVKNVPNNNGRVGMAGVSYGGWLTVMALLDPHPALKAASPQASPADMFLGDDFFHNGAFRLSYGFEYVAMMETSNESFSFQFDRADTFQWYLRLGALSNVNAKYFQEKRPTWNDFVAHPNYDEFWKGRAAARRLGQPRVPTLNVAGWWDQEDFYGPLKIYEAFEAKDTNHLNYLVVGPWNHGGWQGEGNRLGNIDFETATGRYFRDYIQRPFFAWFLKGKGKLDQAEAITFQTGANKWETYEQWPPRKNISERNLFFREGGRLSFDAPQTSSGKDFDSYVSDPAHPVPYRHRPVSPTYPTPPWREWLVEDQRFVHERPDVLSWEGETLTQDVAVVGDIVAHLFASTSGTDSDWIVKLIDVYPEEYPKDPKMAGYQLMVANEVFRGRFRNSFEKPEPLRANQALEYAIDLHTNNHRFLKGHKIMAQVQSTWFPLIDRNPQKFVPNIFRARESDYQRATQRVYRSRQYPTHIRLPVATQPDK